jgi:hypothetical protein
MPELKVSVPRKTKDNRNPVVERSCSPRLVDNDRSDVAVRGTKGLENGRRWCSTDPFTLPDVPAVSLQLAIGASWSDYSVASIEVLSGDKLDTLHCNVAVHKLHQWWQYQSLN